MANIQARSEPINGELLWLQHQHRHRSYSIFNNVPGSDTTLKARRADKKLWDHIKALPGRQINQFVFHYIREAGFAGIFKTGFHHLDHGLVTALVERWRPETHTFHFPMGEATITLQDVQVLWGLPIDGPPVCGMWESLDTYQWMYYCQQWLGFCPADTDIRSGKIKMSALITQLEDDLEDEHVAYQQRARVYILALLGGHLFVDSGHHEVSLNLIQNIEDLSREGRKSWGSAVLAYLYRNLCTAAEKSDAKGIQGALVLLQYWAWERMPHIAPTIRNGDTYDYDDCYACRWNYTMSFLDAPSHVVVTFRAAFTALKNEQFRWTPYDGIINLLPQDCRDGRQIWAYSGWLIFWSTVEPHLAHRVTRQFGWIQGIPEAVLLMSPQQHREIHDTTRIGRSNTDWGDVHAQYIAIWNQRHQMVFPGIDGVTTTPEYMRWYYPRTVLFITNPGLPGRANQYPEWGATQQFYEEGMREIHSRAEQTSQRYPGSSPLMQDFMMMPEQMMNFGHNQDRMSYGSQNFQFPPSAYHPAPPHNPGYNPRGFFNPAPSPGSFHPANNPTSFYSRPHPVFSTPTTPTMNYGAGSSSFNLFNMDTNAFAPDYQFSPIAMQNLSGVGTSRNPPNTRDYRDVNLGDDDDDNDNDGGGGGGDDDDDDEPEQHIQVRRARRQIRRPHCGTGGHR